MVTVERVPTGLEKLDKLLKGGFPEKSINLAVGSYGCGKTIMSMQFLWKGLQNGEKCLYISMEEPVDSIRFDAKVMGWDFEDYEEDDQLHIAYLSPNRPEIGFLDEISNVASKIDVDRIVIDSISIMLGEQGEKDSDRRKEMYNLYNSLKRTDATCLITAETKEKNDFSRYGVAEYVCDGVLNLHYLGFSDQSFRDIEIRKMRNTNYTPGSHPYQITGTGIELKPEFRDKDFMERYKRMKKEQKRKQG